MAQTRIALQAFVERVKSDMRAMHGDLTPDMEDRARRALETYYNAIDKEGFVFDFDVAWEWAEYSSKANAKAVIKGTKNKNGSWRTKPLLRENIDYQITKIDPGLGFPEYAGNSSSGHGGVRTGAGRKTEKITMTGRGFNQFVLSAHTPVGQILRDVVFSAMRIMKQLQEAIQNGTHRIVRVRPDASMRDIKRIKVCETQKALMREMVDANPSFARFCGQVNGETNKATTGRYKYETARELGMPAKKVNARDYMTPAQLAVAEAIEILSKDKMKSAEDPLAVHKDICERMVASIKDELSSTERSPMRREAFVKSAKRHGLRRVWAPRALRRNLRIRTREAARSVEVGTTFAPLRCTTTS